MKKNLTDLVNRIVKSKENPIITLLIDILVFVLIVVIAFFIFSPNLKATWWIIDDHEIAEYIGSDGVFSFGEIIPTLLTKTEINPDSTFARFRPAYYFLRLVETCLWIRVAPMGWYLARIFIFIFFIFILYLCFKKINGTIIGALLAIFCTTPVFWADIFARLGPSESYAVFGVGLFLIGLLLYLKKRLSIFAWILFTLGVVISVGSKENMSILLLPYFFIFFLHVRTKNKHKSLAWASTGICLLWSVWIYITLFLRIKKLGTDIYNNPVGLGSRILELWEYINENWFLIISILIPFGIGLLVLLFWKNEKAKLPAKVMIVGSTFILALIISQVLFYIDQLDGRYYFPLYLFLPLIISLFIYIFQQYALLRNNAPLQIFFTIITVLILLVSINTGNWKSIRAESYKNVQRTQDFMNVYDPIVDYLKSKPEESVIFYGTYSLSDYELIFSYQQFLRASEIDQNFYILRDPPNDYRSYFSEFELRLEDELIDKSINGDPFWTISPINELPTDSQECVLITLVVERPSPIQCQMIFDGNVIQALAIRDK